MKTGRFDLDGESQAGSTPLIVVGPTPPPVDGVSVMTVTLRDTLRDLHLLAGPVDTSDRRPHETIGRFDLVNVRLALTHAWRLHRCLRQCPSAAAYIPISQGALGYLRDSLLIAIVAAHRRPVYLHRHGGAFRRFYERSNIVRGMIRATLRYAHQVWTLTPGIQIDFRDLVAPDRLRSLANAVPDPGVPPSRADRSSATDLRVLYVGNIRPDKHCFDLLAALRLLGSDARGWEVNIAGATTPDVAGRLQTELAELRNRGVKACALGEIDPTLWARDLAWTDVLAGERLITLGAVIEESQTAPDRQSCSGVPISGS